MLTHELEHKASAGQNLLLRGDFSGVWVFQVQPFCHLHQNLCGCLVALLGSTINPALESLGVGPRLQMFNKVIRWYFCTLKLRLACLGHVQFLSYSTEVALSLTSYSVTDALCKRNDCFELPVFQNFSRTFSTYLL